MTDTEAIEMIAKLERHFGCPVWPLPKVCKAFYTWMNSIRAANDEARREPGTRRGWKYAMYLDQMKNDIDKSNLLGRLLIAKERVRTEKCPIHKGIYDSGAMFFNPCPHQCDGTGWLRADPNVGGYKRDFIDADDWKIVVGKLMFKDSHTGEWKVIATDAEKIP